MSGRSSKRKGSRIEREIVHLHQALGIESKRVPLSGAAAHMAGDEFSGDVIIDLANLGRLRAEVKARAGGQGFITLERWLSSNDLLFLRRDRAEPMVLMRFDLYARLIGGKHDAE